MERYGALYEHSPWIAEQVFETLGEGDHSREELEQCFRDTVLSASLEQQLELLNAHPELACARSERLHLTEESSMEQSVAGLDQCTEEEYEAFNRLNRQYRDSFGFPFILAVRGYRREEILQIFRERIGNDPDAELSEAIRQVCRIGQFRLEAVFRGNE
jgi:OHCU decarboxylase